MTSSTAPPADDDRTIRPFADTLKELSGGRIHDELSVLLRDVVDAVKLHAKQGSLQLNIKVAPISKGNTDQLTVTADVRSKVPASEAKPSFFYPDADGNLRRDDPNQLKFEALKEVTRQEPIDLGAAGGNQKEKQA